MLKYMPSNSIAKKLFRHFILFHPMLLLALPLVVSGVSSKSRHDYDLIVAAENGSMNGVKKAINNGANPNARMKIFRLGIAEEISPLMAVCYSAYPSNQSNEIIEYLLDNGGVINLLNENGRTALMVCSARGLLEQVKILLERGADPSISDIDCRTAADRAAEMTQFRVVKLLSPDWPSKGSLISKSLIGAAREGSLTRLKEMIRLGGDPNAKDFYGETALIIASRSCLGDNVKVLIQAGADVNLPSSISETPLHAAAEKGCVVVVKILLDSGARPNTRDANDEIPLLRAVRSGNLDGVKLLISRGSDANAMSKGGNSAMKVAVDRGYKNIVSFLRQIGVKR